MIIILIVFYTRQIKNSFSSAKTARWSSANRSTPRQLPCAMINHTFSTFTFCLRYQVSRGKTSNLSYICAIGGSMHEILHKENTCVNKHLEVKSFNYKNRLHRVEIKKCILHMENTCVN